MVLQGPQGVDAVSIVLDRPLSPRKVPGYGSFRYGRIRVQCVLEEVVMIRDERNFSRTTDEDERRARDSPVAEEDSSAESDPGWKRHRISN